MSETNDIVAVGLDLKPRTLLHAYQHGIFPWPTPGLPLLWYCPLKRGVLLFENFHYPKRLQRYLANSGWTFTIDRAFEQVIDACGERGEEGTWITAEMKAAYLELNRLGHAHSVEVWNNGKLIGGLYGVDTANYFAGESMFHRESNASKGALIFVIALLKSVGREWMDIQVVTPHMEALGAEEITRNRFLKLLATAKAAQKFGSGVGPFSDQKEFTHGDLASFI